MQKRWAALGAAGVMAFVGTMIASPNSAHAQVDPCVTAGGGTVCRTNALPQGTIGGALLGAEAVILIEGAAGVRNRWVLIGTGIAGLVAGGAGGFVLDFFLDNQPPIGSGMDPNPNPPGMTAISTGMLVVGLGLVIPTAIVFASATMYRPDETAQSGDDNTGGNEVLEESSGPSPSGGATPGGAAPAETPRPQSMFRMHRRGRIASGRTARPAGSLFSVAGGRFELGVPAVGMVSSFTREETRQFGLAAQSELRVPVLSAQF